MGNVFTVRSPLGRLGGKLSRIDKSEWMPEDHGQNLPGHCFKTVEKVKLPDF
jgi:hypothetical protein